MADRITLQTVSTHHREWRRETVLDVYNLLLGIFLFVSPWLFAFSRTTARFDAWGSAAIIALMSLAAILLFAEWEEWIVLLGGLWLIASPWILGFAHTTAMHIVIGVGVFAAYLAALDLWLIHYHSND